MNKKISTTNPSEMTNEEIKLELYELDWEFVVIANLGLQGEEYDKATKPIEGRIFALASELAKRHKPSNEQIEFEARRKLFRGTFPVHKYTPYTPGASQK